ncbi:MAG: hypothetical protein P8X70_02030 [Nanoarchaeota archaeon]
MKEKYNKNNNWKVLPKKSLPVIIGMEILLLTGLVFSGKEIYEKVKENQVKDYYTSSMRFY